MKGFMILMMLITVICSAKTDYTKLIHNTDPNAKCLDGSSPMIYLH